VFRDDHQDTAGTGPDGGAAIAAQRWFAGRARSRGRGALCTLALSAALLASFSATALAAKTVTNGSSGAIYEKIHWGTKSMQRADIYASATRNSPIVMLVHGGGWRKQPTLGYLRREALELQGEGYSVFAINYQQDTAEMPAFPAEPDDIMAATQWAISQSAEYNADPTNVILIGGSAGGNLVSLAAEKLDTAKPGTVRAVVSLSGPMDFETLVPMVESGELRSHSFITSIFQAVGASEEEGEVEVPTPALLREGSPALNIPSKGSCPDWMLLSSEVDLVPLPQAEEMYEDLLAAKCTVSLKVMPGRGHAFGYWNSASSAIFSFLKGE
jgi:acetyl esterase/lipase